MTALPEQSSQQQELIATMNRMAPAMEALVGSSQQQELIATMNRMATAMEALVGQQKKEGNVTTTTISTHTTKKILTVT